MLSGNSLRQTVRTHRTSVHQAAKLVAAFLRVAGVTAGLAESNGSLYRRVYDSRYLQADCQEPGSAPEPYTRSVIEYGLATFTFFYRLQRVSEARPTVLGTLFHRLSVTGQCIRFFLSGIKRRSASFCSDDGNSVCVS